MRVGVDFGDALGGARPGAVVAAVVRAEELGFDLALLKDASDAVLRAAGDSTSRIAVMCASCEVGGRAVRLPAANVPPPEELDRLGCAGIEIAILEMPAGDPVALLDRVAPALVPYAHCTDFVAPGTVRWSASKTQVA